MPKLINIKPLFLLTLFCVAGCASMTSVPLAKSNQPKYDWQRYRKTLSQLQHFKASGVIGIILNHQGNSANFIWQQNGPNHYQLKIYGPFGIDTTTFTGNGKSVTMTDKQGKQFHATSISQLMEAQLGWHLPINGLYYWSRALPEPDLPYQLSLNAYGLPASLKQSGWIIRYQDYALFAGEYTLAQKITLSRDTLKLTAVISSWQIKN